MPDGHTPPRGEHVPPPPWPHPACLDDAVLLKQCSVTRGRSGGPGGQNRNKVETLIELTHVPTGLAAHAGERRSQAENRGVAVRRLRLVLAVQFRAGVQSGEVGSALWRSRRRAAPTGRDPRAGSPAHSKWDAGGLGTLTINPDHSDYPSLLAEALDVIAACDWDHKKASLRLECSPSQLVKLLRHHPPAMLMFNARREQAGLSSVK